VLVININSLLDSGDLGAEVERAFWSAPLRIFMLEQSDAARELLELPRAAMGGRIAHFMTFDESNPNSILSCLTRARENARSIRENISAEMWENLNTLYWTLRSDSSSAAFDESPVDLLKQITNGSLLFQGLGDQTLAHGQPWQFIQLGKYLERIDVTCRVIETKLDILHAVERKMETAERNMHLLSIVRSCCAREAFRRTVGEIDPDDMASFVLLQREFPRSVAFCARQAHDAIAKIRAETKPNEVDPAESILGRLHAELQYTPPVEVNAANVTALLQRIGGATLDASLALKKSYFLQ
jgi:uncharacterized alpha-E superfamily protein